MILKLLLNAQMIWIIFLKTLKNTNPPLSTIKNIKNFYNGSEKILSFFNDYTRMVSDIKYKSIHRQGLKILTPKQMVQRLPIVLAQVKAVNTSENVLNEIREIIYYLYGAKEITKKVYNNIMGSIKL